MYLFAPQLFRNLVKAEWNKTNPGLITITPAGVMIWDTDPIDVTLDDWFLLTIQEYGTHAAPGGYNIDIVSPGPLMTASAEHKGRDISVFQVVWGFPWVPGGYPYMPSLMFILHVTAGGVLSLRWVAYSNGANTTVNPGYINMQILLLR